MRGKVLGFDTANGSGVISGEDNNRYPLKASSLGAGVSILRAGQDVDFIVKGEGEDKIAAEIFPVKNSVSAGAGEKSKIAAGLLALFLGGLGIHKFYLGNNGAGIIMLLVFLFGFLLLGIPSWIIAIIALIEAIIYFTKSDDDFYDIYVVKKKAWF